MQRRELFWQRKHSMQRSRGFDSGAACDMCMMGVHCGMGAVCSGIGSPREGWADADAGRTHSTFGGVWFGWRGCLDRVLG